MPRSSSRLWTGGEGEKFSKKSLYKAINNLYSVHFHPFVQWQTRTIQSVLIILHRNEDVPCVGAHDPTSLSDQKANWYAANSAVWPPLDDKYVVTDSTGEWCQLGWRSVLAGSGLVTVGQKTNHTLMITETCPAWRHPLSWLLPHSLISQEAGNM